MGWVRLDNACPSAFAVPVTSPAWLSSWSRRCYAHSLMKAHEARGDSHQPLPRYLHAQLYCPFTVRRLRTGILGSQRRQMVCLGTTRLLRSGYRPMDSHTAADHLRSAFLRRRPLLAYARTFPGGRRPEASRRLLRLQTPMTTAATPNPDASNPAITPRHRTGRPQHGVADRERWAETTHNNQC